MNEVKTFRIKKLIDKMSFPFLKEVCEREEWVIPSSSHLKGQELPYDIVWTSDMVDASEYTEDDLKIGVRLGKCFLKETENQEIANQNFRLHCVVLIPTDKK